MKKIFMIATLLLLIPPNLLLAICYSAFDFPIFTDTFNTAYLGISISAFSFYNSVSVNFFYELYYHHRLAFKTHYKRLIALFIATQVTLIALVVISCYNLLISFCYKTEFFELSLDN